MYHLTVQNGQYRGTTWALADRPLVVGRGESCDIRIVDPLVSRRHCEVHLGSEGVVVRDLGSSNTTFVNGRPVNEAVLKAGDELAVGPFILAVTRLADASVHDGGRGLADATCVVSLDRALYLSTTPAPGETYDLPRTVNELRELFALSRRFSQASTVVDLMAMLHGHLHRRYRLEAVWIAAWSPLDENLSLYPLQHARNADAPPRAALRRAIETRAGCVQPAPSASSGGARTTDLLVVPLAHGQEPVGALALLVADSAQGAAHELEYLMALAEAFAPHWRALERAEQLRRDAERFRRRAGMATDLVGDSQTLHALRERIRRAARTGINILVLGETGTGKELVARLIHEWSPRSGRPLVVVNCAAIPHALFESEMFGHEKGAFTGATARRIGRFEEAHGGTLFLDEVGDLSSDNQARILRALEDGAFRRVGGAAEIRVDVRIVAAANRSLYPASPDKPFRDDLYHRLNGLEITVPPLRERKEDIAVLAHHFLEQFQPDSVRPVPGLGSAALHRLEAWRWPGNVRELRMCIERAAALCASDTIGPEDIVLPEAGPVSPYAPDGASGITLAEAERRHIERTLHRYDGNVRATARALDISRMTLYRKLREYGLSD